MLPRDIGLAVKIAAQADVPLWIHGIAGIGKSEIAEAVAQALGFHVIDLRLATQEVVDLIGRVVEKAVAWDEDGKPTELVSTWAMPEWVWEVKQKWELEGIPTIVFMDEMNRAPHDVVQAVYQFVLKKQIHTHILPAATRVVVAGNPPTDKYDVDAMDDSMNTRFCHVQANVSEQQWLKDFAADNCHLAIQNFIAAAPYQLCQEPSGEPFIATSLAVNRPRTWKFASDLFTVLEEERMFYQNPTFALTLLSGVVGTASATEFISSMKDGWYTLEDVLSQQIQWKDVYGKGTADIRLITQMGNILKFSDIDTDARKIALVKFISAGAKDRKDLMVGLLKACHKSGDPELSTWLLDHDEISDLVLSLHDEMRQAQQGH